MTSPILSLVLPFYRNPSMLRRHFEEWASYPDACKDAIEVVVVDDGSPAREGALFVPRPAGLPALRIYRVREDRPWHQHGARNLGAHEAVAPWLYLGDMDHLIPVVALEQMLRLCNYEAIYTFGRVDAPDLTPTTKHGVSHPHPNTFLMSKASYWRIGGYDEDLTGYGTDSFFRARLTDANVPVTHRDDIRIVRYPREVVPDASTRTLPRKEGRPVGHRAHLKALAAQKALTRQRPTVLAFEWERVL